MRKLQAQGVHHITLVGADRQTSIDFWEGVLGMPFVFEQPNLDQPSESHLYFDPGDGRLIDRARAVEHAAIQRDPLAGPDDERAANFGQLRGNLLFAALGAQHAHRPRSEVQQRRHGPPRSGHAPRLERERQREQKRDGGRFEPLADGDRADDGEIPTSSPRHGGRMRWTLLTSLQRFAASAGRWSGARGMVKNRDGGVGLLPCSNAKH